MSTVLDVGLSVLALYAAVAACVVYLRLCIRAAARAERRAMAHLTAITPIDRKGETS